ncbi:MAG: alkaline phosphatase family protein [Candidatus Eisenbacteria bacterium]
MKPSQEELLREARNNLRVGLLTGLLGGVLLGLLFATATFALNPELLDSVKDVLVLSLGLQAVYAVFCLALGLLGALGKTILFAFTGRSLSDTKTAAFVTGTVFFLITMTYGYLWCRWHRIGGLVPEHRPTMAELPVLLVVAAVAVLLARLLTYAFYLLIVHFKKPDRRQPGDMRKAFFVLLYMVGAFVIFLVVLQLTRPGENHFAGLSREDVVAVDHPVVLLGIDGLDRSDVERMLGAGRLSSFARGAKAAVTVGGQPIPPVAWTLVATGRTLEAHGIVDYQAQLVRGLSRPFTVSPNQVGLFQLFQDVLPFFRLTRPVPMRSYMRGSKGLWNIASDAGLESAVVNWWVSYPAEKVQGRMVSNQTFLRLVLEGKAGRESGHNSRPDDPDVGGSSVGAGSGSGMRSGSGSDGTKITDPSARSEDPHGPLRLEGQGETFPSSLLQELAPLADAAPDGLPARPVRRSRPPGPGESGVRGSSPTWRRSWSPDLFYARTTSYLWRPDTRGSAWFISRGRTCCVV